MLVDLVSRGPGAGLDRRLFFLSILFAPAIFLKVLMGGFNELIRYSQALSARTVSLLSKNTRSVAKFCWPIRMRQYIHVLFQMARDTHRNRNRLAVKIYQAMAWLEQKQNQRRAPNVFGKCRWRGVVLMSHHQMQQSIYWERRCSRPVYFTVFIAWNIGLKWPCQVCALGESHIKRW